MFKLDKVQDEKEDSKIRWYTHVKRMNARWMPRQALRYQYGGFCLKLPEDNRVLIVECSKPSDYCFARFQLKYILYDISSS